MPGSYRIHCFNHPKWMNTLAGCQTGEISSKNLQFCWCFILIEITKLLQGKVFLNDFVPPPNAPNWTSRRSYFLAVILPRHSLKDTTIKAEMVKKLPCNEGTYLLCIQVLKRRLLSRNSQIGRPEPSTKTNR